MIDIGDFIIYNDSMNFLGEGTFSKVYRGIYNGLSKKSIKNGTYIAAKIIKTHNLTPKALSILEDEIYIMNIIKEDPHKNIVECYDIVKTLDSIYIFLELCDSGDLRSILKNPIKEIYSQLYFMQLAEGLKYLDRKKIVHRDIKPRNILLSNNRRVLKIADFGFAIQAEKDNLYETICGSPLYMAPEITRKNNYNNQTDLWSIGMILYEMIYGFHPFQHCRNISELQKNINDQTINIPPENNTNKNISQECLSLLKKLLEKDVSNRITWDEFFNHKWLNNNDIKLDDIISSSENINDHFGNSSQNIDKLEPLKEYESISEMRQSYNIIDNYFGDESVEDIFNLEFSENSKITYKEVIDKSSILERFDGNSNKYEIVDKINKN